jgi:type IV secretion system protein VirB11
MAASRAESLIKTIASKLNIEATEKTPIVEGELPYYGCRFEGVIYPIVESPCFAIRKKASLIYTLDDYVKSGIMSHAQHEVISHHIRQKHNILVVGGTGSGKTTLCNAVLDYISEVDNETRICVIEDTRELQINAPNVVDFRTSDCVDMTQLLKVCMRMRPDRIVVGEVRDKAALALVKAWNTGHSGGVATVHANNAESGLMRIEQLVMEANVPVIKEVIAEAVNCIVSIQKTNEGRKITEVLQVNGVSDSCYIFNKTC